MKIMIFRFFKVGLIIILTINVSCQKDDDVGESIQEIIDDSKLTSFQIEVLDFSSLDGNLAIAVFNNAENFDSGIGAYIDSIIPINNYNMSIFISNIEPGNYVVSVFHDADESGDITFGGFLNLIPQEGFGFSNNPTIGASQPGFNDCSFFIEEGQTIFVPINLVYF